MISIYKLLVIGSLAGLANGFFGAGGGMILVPLFTKWLKFSDKEAMATSVSVILPLSIVSVVIYFLRGSFDIKLAYPFLIGGFIGGIISGKIFIKIPIIWLKRALGVVIVYGGVRNLLW